MERPVKGDVVVTPFPFADLPVVKRRPALVIAELEQDDVILCQITSQQVRDRYAVALDERDFESGTIRQKSNIRPNRIFTADSRIILYRAGHIYIDKISEVIDKIIEILRQ